MAHFWSFKSLYEMVAVKERYICVTLDCAFLVGEIPAYLCYEY